MPWLRLGLGIVGLIVGAAWFGYEVRVIVEMVRGKSPAALPKAPEGSE